MKEKILAEFFDKAVTMCGKDGKIMIADAYNILSSILTAQEGNIVYCADRMNKIEKLIKLYRSEFWEAVELIQKAFGKLEDKIEILTAQEGEKESPMVRVLFGELLDKWFDLPLSVRHWEELESVNRLADMVDNEINSDDWLDQQEEE